MQASTMSSSVRISLFAQLAILSSSLVEFAQETRDQVWGRDMNDAGFELQTLETVGEKIEGDKMEPTVVSRIESIYRNVVVTFVTAAGKVGTNGVLKSKEGIAAFAKIVDSLEQIVNSKAPHANDFKLAHEAAKRAMIQKDQIAYQAIRQTFDLIGYAFLTLTRQNASYALSN
jgi:hypothetical protein